MTVKQIEGYQIYMNKVLGKGSYGSVYLGKKDGTDEQVAVKILSKDSIDQDEYLKAALKNQIDILQKVNSDNIVGFYDVMESSKNYYIIQELCDGDLSKLIKRNQERPEAEAIEMLRQICNGFLALVREGIIHRDLKPANIMTKGHTLKLGDFGFAKQMREESMAATCVGTPLYMSLQILKGQNYTSKCDIWALGFIFYEILHGTTPWIANTESQLVKNIQKDSLSIRRKDLSPDTQNFIQRCLELKQQNRISWDQIFSHPIFKGYFISKNSNREFENKLKMIMNKLRFYIQKMNLDMKKVMDSMGFGQYKTQITFGDFYHFLLNVYPEITKEEADYCFKKTDTDNSGSISVTELKHMLLSNGIKLESQFDVVPAFEKNQFQEETFLKISKETSRKVKSCFEKLYKIIVRNNLSLWKVFSDFDKKKGCLNLAQFSLLLKKLCGTTLEISDEEIRMGFRLIDEDGSDSIQFSELNKYYSKINGIPTSMNLPPKQAMIPETMQFKNSSKHKKAVVQQNPEPMSIEQPYNPQQQGYTPSKQQTYSNLQQQAYKQPPPQTYNNPQPNYNPQQPVFNNPQQHQSYPGYQQNYPPQNYNQMGFPQQNSGFQQQYNPPPFQQNFNPNNSFSQGNTGNFYHPGFNEGYNPQANSQGPYPNNSFQGNPNYPAQNQGFMSGQGNPVQGNLNLGGLFNPLDLLGRRI